MSRPPRNYISNTIKFKHALKTYVTGSWSICTVKIDAINSREAVVGLSTCILRAIRLNEVDKGGSHRRVEEYGRNVAKLKEVYKTRVVVWLSGCT